ncbi:MAG TPA: hypothetical protein VMU40_05455 [Steroidobacteraceae bacterium]|nr:hypothetical protein [Steroidobacteraceae bacterium]
MFSRTAGLRILRVGLCASAAWALTGGAQALQALPTSQPSSAPVAGTPATGAGGASSSSSGGTRSRFPPGRPTTLFNSGDPTLALTPPLLGSRQAPRGSTPPNPDPRNLEGVWWLQGYEYLIGPEPGVPPPLKPKYIKLLEERIRAKNRGTPEADTETQCLSHGMPRLMESPYPIEIVQTPGRITFLHEVAHEVRRIYMSRPHPKHVRLSFLGDSVGHWEGDTLVVDTVGLDDRPFLDDEGSAHSTQLHIIEHYRKTDGGANLELTVTVIDPVTMQHPYSYHRIYHWRPDVRPQEYICEENNRNAPVNGVTVAK